MVSRREQGYKQGKRRALCTRGCRVKGRFGMQEIVQRSAPKGAARLFISYTRKVRQPPC